MVDVICDTSFLIHFATKRIKNIDSLDVEIGQIRFVVPSVVITELEKLCNNPQKNKDALATLNFSKNYEITGKNGSGKTTLIMCISNNFIGNTFNSNIRRKDTSLMEIGSSPSLMPELSLLENIKYFLFKLSNAKLMSSIR